MQNRWVNALDVVKTNGPRDNFRRKDNEQVNANVINEMLTLGELVHNGG